VITAATDVGYAHVQCSRGNQSASQSSVIFFWRSVQVELSGCLAGKCSSVACHALAYVGTTLPFDPPVLVAQITNEERDLCAAMLFGVVCSSRTRSLRFHFTQSLPFPPNLARFTSTSSIFGDGGGL